MSSPRNIVMRPFEAQDDRAIATLWQEVFPDDPPWNEPFSVLEKKRDVQDDLLFVAVADGIIVGTVMGGYDGHRGWVYTLAVKPSFRRQGVGAALIRTLESALRALGCVKVNLQVRAGNESVVSFYENLGFLQEQRVSMGKLLSGETKDVTPSG